MSFDADIDRTMSLRRNDNGKLVLVDINTDSVPHNPMTPSLMAALVVASASPPQHAQFATLWQERERPMLVEQADDPKLIHL